MSTAIRDDARQMVFHAAGIIRPGQTVKSQINAACKALGLPPGNWRVTAAWYNQAGCWSAAAIHDLQQRYLKWREIEARRAASTAQTEALIRAQRERQQLEATRNAIRTQLATIERQLALADATLRLSRDQDMDR